MPDFFDDILNETVSMKTWNAVDEIMSSYEDEDIYDKTNDIVDFLPNEVWGNNCRFAIIVSFYIHTKYSDDVDTVMSRLCYISRVLADTKLGINTHKNTSRKIKERHHILPKGWESYYGHIEFGTNIIEEKQIFRFLNFLSSVENIYHNIVLENSDVKESRIESLEVEIILNTELKIKEHIGKDSWKRYRIFDMMDIPYRYKILQQKNLNCESLLMRFTDHLWETGFFANEEYLKEKVKKWFDISAKMIEIQEKRQ